MPRRCGDPLCPDPWCWAEVECPECGFVFVPDEGDDCCPECHYPKWPERKSA